MSVERDQTLTPLNYIDQRIRNINDRYAQCHSYVFSCVSYIEQQQMNRNINFCTTQRGIKKKGADGSTEYKLEDPWVVFENISNSPKWVYTDLLHHHTLNYFLRYWSVRRMELKAMLENVGPFHIFFTLSCGDRRYPEHQFWFNVAYYYQLSQCQVFRELHSLLERPSCHLCLCCWFRGMSDWWRTIWDLLWKEFQRTWAH